MKFLPAGIFIILLIGTSACAPLPADRYNTQKGAVIGGGIGAIIGQAVGHNTKGTLIGAGTGTLIGALAGNAIDQAYAASAEAAHTGRRVVYYGNYGSAVEATPVGYNAHTRCHKVRKRIWRNGQIINDSIEEVCEGERSTNRYIY